MREQENVRERESENQTSLDKREYVLMYRCVFLLALRIFIFRNARCDPRDPQGAVGGMPLQPHESHVPFVQQFLVDHNLHGMNFVDFREVAARMPLPAVCTIIAACIIDVSIVAMGLILLRSENESRVMTNEAYQFNLYACIYTPCCRTGPRLARCPPRPGPGRARASWSWTPLQPTS